MNFIEFSKEEKKELLSGFKKLKTVKAKLEFWEKELRCSYVYYLEETPPEFYDFRLELGEGNERERLNNWILDNIPKHLTYVKYLDLRELKKDLNRRLNLTKD